MMGGGMNFKRAVSWILLTGIVFLLSGCSPSYVITQNLEESFPTSSICSVGYILDELPGDFPEDKKPTQEDIEKFKGFIKEALVKEELFDMIDENKALNDYEVDGRLLDYKKGSGFLRFMFGAWAGGAKVTISMKLVDKHYGTEVFAGNFTGQVTSGYEAGIEMFKRVAKDFARALKKELVKLEKNK